MASRSSASQVLLIDECFSVSENGIRKCLLCPVGKATKYNSNTAKTNLRRHLWQNHKSNCILLKIDPPKSLAPKEKPPRQSISDPIVVDEDEPLPPPIATSIVFNPLPGNKRASVDAPPPSKRQRQSLITQKNLIPRIKKDFEECMSDFLAAESLPSSIVDSPFFHRDVLSVVLCL